MSILDFPIGDNLATTAEFCQVGVDDGDPRMTELLTVGPFEFFSNSADDGFDSIDDLDPVLRDDILFGYGYLRGLGDAWNMTALQVWEEWQHMSERARA